MRIMQEIDGKILQFLRRQDRPVTTGRVAKGMKISWSRAQIHLHNLMAEGFVKRARGQWMITEEGRARIYGWRP